MSLERAAERGGDHGGWLQIFGVDTLDQDVVVGHRLVDMPVDIAFVVGLRRADKQCDLVEALPHLQCVVQPAAVGHQNRQRDVLGDVDAVENFDGIGAWRDQDNGEPIDASGQLPNGTSVNGAADLAHVLASNPTFARCVVKQLFTYTHGRAPDDASDAFCMGCLRMARLPARDRLCPTCGAPVRRSSAF